MKICPRCQGAYPDDASYCPLDGVRLDDDGKRTMAIPDSGDKLVGRIIASRYRLLRRLGAGGMASVYLARHVLIERVNAIKVLRKDLSANAAYRERFLREARAVNRINHPSIVEITDVGEADGVAYLVMEFISGESLMAHIRRGPFPWARAAKVAIQIASALGRAHQMSVIHRDLKPENVLLLPGPATFFVGDTPVDDIVKLTDFGIAKLTDAPSITFSEQIFGTPGYIAPEFVEGLPVDARADLYSLGVVLYEMLSGRLPFESKSQAEMLLKPLSQPATPIATFVPHLPPTLEHLIGQLLERRADDRPRDAFVVQESLLDLLRRQGEAPLTSRHSSGPRPSREDLLRTLAMPSVRPSREAAGVLTSEMGLSWRAALQELGEAIARAHQRGPGGREAAERATVLRARAEDMVNKVERTAEQVASLQARVDALEAAGKDFRAQLGRAIDVLSQDRSRERAQLEAIRLRRTDLAERATLAIEVETLMREEARMHQLEGDLSFQIDTLQAELEKRNESFARDWIESTGELEGYLAAMQQASRELVRLLDDAFAVVDGRVSVRSA